MKLAALDREMASQEKNIESELAKLKEQIKNLEEKKAGLSGAKGR